MGELKKDVPWELARSLRQFERAYMTDEIEEWLWEQDGIQVESDLELFPQQEATPEIGVS